MSKLLPELPKNIPTDVFTKDIAKRIAIIKKENNFSYREFSDALNNDISHGSIQNALKGTHDIGSTFLIGLVYILGYSPYWILLGIGKKKIQKEDRKMITDFQQLRAELEVTTAKLWAMESKVNLAFKEIEDLKNK